MLSSKMISQTSAVELIERALFQTRAQRRKRGKNLRTSHGGGVAAPELDREGPIRTAFRARESANADSSLDVGGVDL